MGVVVGVKRKSVLSADGDAIFTWRDRNTRHIGKTPAAFPHGAWPLSVADSPTPTPTPTIKLTDLQRLSTPKGVQLIQGHPGERQQAGEQRRTQAAQVFRFTAPQPETEQQQRRQANQHGTEGTAGDTHRAR